MGEIRGRELLRTVMTMMLPSLRPGHQEPSKSSSVTEPLRTAQSHGTTQRDKLHLRHQPKDPVKHRQHPSEMLLHSVPRLLPQTDQLVVV